MPEQFPTLDPTTGELVEVTYYDIAEVAAMLHVSESTVRRNLFAKSDPWPHLTIGRGHWMSASDIGWVVAQSTVDPPPFPGVPEAGPARLGTPLTDRDLEGIR